MNKVRQLEKSLDKLRDEYSSTLDEYARKINLTILIWMEKNNVTEDLKPAVLRYYNQYANDFELTLAYYMTMLEDEDLNSLTTSLASGESVDKVETWV